MWALFHSQILFERLHGVFYTLGLVVATPPTMLYYYLAYSASLSLPSSLSTPLPDSLNPVKPGIKGQDANVVNPIRESNKAVPNPANPLVTQANAPISRVSNAVLLNYPDTIYVAEGASRHRADCSHSTKTDAEKKKSNSPCYWERRGRGGLRSALTPDRPNMVATKLFFLLATFSPPVETGSGVWGMGERDRSGGVLSLLAGGVGSSVGTSPASADFNVPKD